MTTTIRCLTHDGREYIIDIENYNPELINNQINDNNVTTVLLGDHILARITIKEIVPIKEN